MRQIKYSLLVIFCLIGISNKNVISQDSYGYDEISFLTEYFGCGARAIGLGGAFIGVAEDYSSLYWNPAGLGQIKKMELMASMNHLTQSTNAEFLNSTTKDKITSTRLDALGFVLPVPTYRGSLVFAFGYHRVENIGSILSFEGFNPGSSAMSVLFDEPYIPNSLYQSENVTVKGSLGNYSFGVSTEVNENLWVGGSLNHWRGRNDYNFLLQEVDQQNLYETYPNDFDNYYLENNINSEIRAWDIKIGGLFRVNKNVRVGATITSPKTFSIQEVWDVNDQLMFDDGATDPTSDNGITDYEVRMPFTFAAGVSFTLPRILISGGIEYYDWSQIEYLTDPPFEWATRSDVNRSITQNVEPVMNKRVGAEVLLPGLKNKIRGGYIIIPNPIKGTTSDNDKKFFTVGGGFLVGTQTMLDIVYVRGSWKNESSDEYINEKVEEDRKISKIYVTLSFRF